jgi:hypothetical protein
MDILAKVADQDFETSVRRILNIVILNLETHLMAKEQCAWVRLGTMLFVLYMTTY